MLTYLPHVRVVSSCISGPISRQMHKPHTSQILHHPEHSPVDIWHLAAVSSTIQYEGIGKQNELDMASNSSNQILTIQVFSAKKTPHGINGKMVLGMWLRGAIDLPECSKHTLFVRGPDLQLDNPVDEYPQFLEVRR
ncbi:hypothetical protein TNCV_2801651 [Trichonephila clavipes]|nr:hypothetical protein TNCV_2801651 [Trichonephila clavipes]